MATAFQRVLDLSTVWQSSNMAKFCLENMIKASENPENELEFNTSDYINLEVELGLLIEPKKSNSPLEVEVEEGNTGMRIA
jgi:hypothetical protein